MKKLLFLVVLAALVSCETDKEYFVNLSIQNNSTHELSVEFVPIEPGLNITDIDSPSKIISPDALSGEYCWGNGLVLNKFVLCDAQTNDTLFVFKGYKSCALGEPCDEKLDGDVVVDENVLIKRIENGKDRSKYLFTLTDAIIDNWQGMEE